MNRIGIRKEDDRKKFERRAPLTPAHIREIRQRYPEAEFVIESGYGKRYERAFADDEYRAAGALIGSLDTAQVILGIKEVPAAELLPGKVYMYFSHTYKGQPHNMPMLRKLLAHKCTLLDYELIVDDVDDASYGIDRHQRQVFFGHYAGYAGAINTLYTLGQRLEYAGIRSPFLHIKQAIDYHAVPGAQFGDFETALRGVQKAGELIGTQGLPDELLPVVIGLTGGGNVAQAVRHILSHLPVIEIAPEALADFDPSLDEARHHIYLVQFRRQQRAMPQFEAYARQLTVLINGAKWKPHQPRIITRAFLRQLYHGGQPRLQVIGDISCDPNGAIEITHQTYPDDPHYVYNPALDDVSHPWDRQQFEKTCHYGFEGDGIVVMAVANLPAEFPRDASTAFGHMLLPFMAELLHTDFSQPLAQLSLSRQLRRALIAHQGQLTPDFAYLREKIPPRVLILGAGLMSPGVVDYLSRRGYQVTIADADGAQAQQRAAGYPPDQVQALHLPVDEAQRAALLEQLEQVDVAVSLLPAALHPMAAELCIEARTHLVTASYASPEMWHLDDRAKAAGVILLNEVGLDPGLDHMSAMRVIDRVRAARGRVLRFTSYCGGLPSPDAADNPLRFKASWSPAGIVAAANRPARFKQGDEVHTVEPRALFTNPQIMHFSDIAADLEAYPNGDSVFYISAYGLESAETFIRGTLRYAGWSEVMAGLHDLGWFGSERTAEVVAHTVKADGISPAVDAVIQWLGLTETPTGQKSACDHLLTCFMAQPDLRYQPGERDLVAMRHTFDVVYPARPHERIVSSLLATGEPEGLSAMASTVGLTAAICARLILEKAYYRPGVQLPLTADIYDPVLDEMADLGFAFEEEAVCLEELS